MASAAVILGLSGGVVVLYYLISRQGEYIPGDDKSEAKARGVNWVFGDYSLNINNPLATKNRFQDRGSIIETTPGANEQPILLYGHGYETYPIYRVPTRS